MLEQVTCPDCERTMLLVRLMPRWEDDPTVRALEWLAGRCPGCGTPEEDGYLKAV